jgi:hypothetical protein
MNLLKKKNKYKYFERKKNKRNISHLCFRKIILKTKNPIAKNIPVPLIIAIIVYVNIEIL